MYRDQTAPDIRLRRVLRGMLSDHPFFGSLALRMPIQEDYQVKTIQADGTTFRYNPEWIEESTADNIRLALSYGTLACGLKHHIRRADRDTKRWKEASWQVCLPVLRDAGLTDEQGGLEMSVEEAYAQMPESEESDNSQPGPPESGEDNPDLDGQGSGQGNDPGDGSGQSQQPPDSPPSHDPDGHGEVSDSPEPDPKDNEMDWDEAVHTSRQLAKSEGNMPGSANDLITASHKSFVEWTEELRRFMRASARTDYSWRKPNHRYPDVYLPALHSEAMGTLALMIDTSGSLDTISLDRLWGEMRSLVQDVRPVSLTVIQCDMAVQSVEEYDPDDLPSEMDAKGRGGTSFIPAFEAVNELSTTPACALYFTDGDCSKFPDEPGYPVLWVLDGMDAVNFCPPFGEVLTLDSP